MLSHPAPHPPHLRFIQDFPSHLVSRQKISSSSSFYPDFVNASPTGSPTATVEEDRVSSPQPSGNCNYASSSFDSHLPSLSAEIYRQSQNQPFDTNHYRDSVLNTSASSPRHPRPMSSYLSEPPSPAPVHPSASALPSSIPSQSHPRFPHSDHAPYSAAQDRVSPGPERQSRTHQHHFHKYPDDHNFHNHLLDHRRMSEPAVLGAPNLYAMPNPDTSASSRYQHFNFAFNPPHTPRSLYLSRGQHHEPHEFFDQHQTDALDEPISPMNPNFSGGSPPTQVPYSPISDNLYGPSPPGTGTSTSSSAPLSPSRQHLQRCGNGDSMDRKTYSFVALPGNTVKKRPRRRYDEIERLYQCSWPDCNKSYGTLNHLNAHVSMQKHGLKRSPSEFKELRKQWRKAKKEAESAGAIVRRDSFNDGYDDNEYYDQRYLSSHHRMPAVDRYSVSIDDIRYAHDHDGLNNYRQRYVGNLASSWHGGSHISSRSNMQPQYVSSSLPSAPAHHSQLPQLSINSRFHASSSRLPQNSTLLTPLPGYQSLDGYEAYDGDSNSRPGTGHASIGGHSGDEFDR